MIARNDKRQEISDLDLLEQLDLLNGKYYSERIKEAKEVLNDLYKEKLPHEEYVKKEKAIKKRIEEYETIIEKINHVKNKVSLITRAAKEYRNVEALGELIERMLEKYNRELGNEYFQIIRKTKTANDDIEKRMKKIESSHNLAKEIDEVGKYQIGIDRDKIRAGESGYDREIPIKELPFDFSTNLFDDINGKIEINKEILSTIMGQISAWDLFHKYEYGSKKYEHQQDLQNWIENKGIDVEKTQEIIKKYKESKYEPYEKRDIDTLSREGVKIQDILEKSEFLKVRPSTLTDICKQGIDLSMDVNYLKEIMEIFNSAQRYIPEYYEIISDMYTNKKKQLEKIEQEVNKLYQEYKEKYGKKHDKDYSRDYERVITPEIEPSYDKTDRIQEEKEELMQKREQLIEIKEKTTKPKDNAIDYLNSNQEIGLSRSPYYQAYNLQMMKNNTGETFIEYLENNYSSMQELIEYEKYKKEILDKVYVEFESKFGKDAYKNIERFKWFCNHNDTIKELGGINNIIKESDLEEYLDEIKKQKEQSKNSDLDEMFKDEDNISKENIEEKTI